MAIVIDLPQPARSQELARASGAPRPLPRPAPAGIAVLPPLQLLPAPVPEPIPQLPVPPPPALNWRSDPADDERVGMIARSVAQAALEVLAGTRPLQQLARWLGPENYERMQLRAALMMERRAAGERRRAAARHAPAREDRTVRIRSFRVCPVSEGVYEACVVAAEQARGRAVALRIELRRGLWKVTELEIG